MGLGKLPDVVNGYNWELYNIADDYSQDDDLAAKMPDKLREMQELFLVEAAKYDVFPLDNHVPPARSCTAAEPTAGRTVFTYSGESSGLPPQRPQHPRQVLHHHRRGGDPRRAAPRACSIPSAARFGGYGLYLLKGKPVFTYNLLTTEQFRWEGPTRSRPASTPSCSTSTTTAPASARAAPASSRSTARKSPARRCQHTVPFMITLDESFDVGVDTRTGVDDNDYQPPFRFTGKLDKLTIELEEMTPAQEKLLAAGAQSTRNAAQ